MAISKAFAAGAEIDSTGTALTTGTFDSTGYTHLVIGCKWEGGNTTVTPSDNKGSTGWNALTKEVVAGTSDDLQGQIHWVKIGTPGTGHTVTMTTGSLPFRTLLVWRVNADSGEIALDAQTNAEGSGTAIDAGSLATSGASVVSFLLALEYAAVSWTAGTGWTEDWDTISVNFTGGFSRGAETTTPIDPTATASGSMTWGACAASFREDTGGGGPTGPPTGTWAMMGIGI